MKALLERLNRPLSQRPNSNTSPSSPAIRGYHDQLRPSRFRFRTQIESALQDYEKQTGFNMVDHPLATRLQGCTSVEDAMGILREQAQGIDDFHGDNYDGRLMKSLNGAVYVLHKLSTSTVLCEVTGLVRQRM